MYSNSTKKLFSRASNSEGEAISSHQLRVHTFATIDRRSQLDPAAYRQIRSLETTTSSSKRTQVDRFAQLPLSSPPRFTSHLISENVVLEGESLHLEARLEPVDDQNLVVEWYKNGNYLVLGSRTTTSFDFGRVSLDIVSCKPEDSGVYICR